MKKNLEILEVEPKLKKDESKYWRFKTSEGWMSCFDDTTAKQTKAFIGRVVCVEVVESADGKFHNITKCYGKAEEVGMGDTAINVNKYIDEPSRSERKPEVVRPGYPKRHEEVKNTQRGIKNGRNPYDKDPVGLATDIFCEIYDDNKPVFEQMQEAIELVKQAREAFE